MLFDVMTTTVVTVGPDTATPEIAELLLEHGISAVPVVDEDGEVIGMVSEGDLLRFSAEDREARRDRWLAMRPGGKSCPPVCRKLKRAKPHRPRHHVGPCRDRNGANRRFGNRGAFSPRTGSSAFPFSREGRIVGES